MNRERDLADLRAFLTGAVLFFLICVLMNIDPGDTGRSREIAGATAWLVLAICTVVVAATWFGQAMKARRDRGLETSAGRRAVLAFAAPFAAVLIVGLANLAFLAAFRVGYSLFAEHGTDPRPYHDQSGVRQGLAFGVIVGGDRVRAEGGDPPRGEGREPLPAPPPVRPARRAISLGPDLRRMRAGGAGLQVESHPPAPATARSQRRRAGRSMKGREPPRCPAHPISDKRQHPKDSSPTGMGDGP